MTKTEVKVLAWHEILHLVLFIVIFGLFLALPIYKASAQVTNPQDGSIGISGVVPGNPPSQAAVINSPSNGESFSSNPISVTGTCIPGLLVQIYRNGGFAGSALCLEDGSFHLQIDLVNGRNSLVARVFDALNQEGPQSNTVTVTYSASGPVQIFVNPLIVTSNFGSLGADPGKTLKWPISISGGSPPYAVSWDWGDNTDATIYSVSDAGVFTGEHVYNLAGAYEVVIKVTDSNGNTAYVQLVAVANGPAVAGITQQQGTTPATANVQTKYLVWPLYILAFFVVSTFYVGRRYERRKQQQRFAQQAAKAQQASDAVQAAGGAVAG